MASSKDERSPPCDPTTTSNLNSSTSEALRKSSQSLQLVGDITFSQTKRGREVLMINGFSYILSKENKMRYYWRCEPRSCNATLITTKYLIKSKHSIWSTGKK